MRVLAIVAGVVLAAVGGVFAYRAAFLEPHAAIVITESDAREVPNIARVAGGLVLFVGGAALALFAALRRR